MNAPPLNGLHGEIWVGGTWTEETVKCGGCFQLKDKPCAWNSVPSVYAPWTPTWQWLRSGRVHPWDQSRRADIHPWVHGAEFNGVRNGEKNLIHKTLYLRFLCHCGKSVSHRTDNRQVFIQLLFGRFQWCSLPRKVASSTGNSKSWKVFLCSLIELPYNVC